ncbi:sensor histidine kinase [Oceanobacillus alkalisoli]|uniref:sensor histidine kinase n=1 Tax=Oceanobacillus alkalisoli TaxID=2925113 RepID=UPI001EE42914|nr:HAMP domain-containing sensor histidine kinase [Oceanobacillus alkalisoli]MCG5105086.1 HAMP domain-containing histidine kinase [Oceanobacillus alkalisoli]
MRTLYVKLVVATIGIMIFSSILAFILSNMYYQQKLKPENDEKITTIAESIKSYIDEYPNINLTEYLESIASVGYQMYLVDDFREGDFYGAEFRDESLAEQTVEQVLNGEVYHGILEFPQETFVTGFFANELKNTIGVPITHDGENYALFLRPDIKLLFNEMHFLFAWLLVLTILLSIILVAISTKYLVKPISELTAATKSLAEANFNVEIETKRSDELGVLSQSFVQMAKKLEQMDDVRKEFISNISHDIQSPLSNIKGYTNLLENESIRDEEKGEYISIINGEIKRLSSMTDQLLLLASLDRSDDLVKRKTFNLGEQLKELVRNYQWQINEKGLMLAYTLPDIEWNGDPALLNTVWDNLLSNAIKYNKPDGSINLSIEEKDEAVIVTFEDTGIGLEHTEIERIFDRFYRADTSRTRTVEGTGLGLSIVWTIIKLHDGSIQVDSREGEGTVFTVKLPNGK